MESIKLTSAAGWSSPPAADMPADLYYAVCRHVPGVETVLCGETPVGAALYDAGSTAFMIVYILPSFRGRGLGTAAARALIARADGAARLMTAYPESDAGAAAFAGRLGFSRKFASCCMTYTGAAFPDQPLDVRGYRDEDYAAAHALYAEAFHRMRVAVGDFPESVAEPPSEQMRREWAETAGERLVCLYDGEIAGYAHLDGEELASVSVAPAMQRRGIGRMFVKTVVNRILAAGHGKVVLYCVKGNGARALYDELGFAARGTDVYAVKST